LWLPGVFVVSAILAAAGAWLGRISRGKQEVAPLNWLAGLAWADCAAAMLLIVVGGLVTGLRAGMAVPDWPNSFDYNMFLFPLALMTGGAFYEHAHRLLGTLVGAGALILAVRATVARPGTGSFFGPFRHVSCTHPRAEKRACPLAVRKGLVTLIWLAGLAVLAQGIMGGFRVTEDSYTLAVIHGAFAHAVLAALVVIAVMLARGWVERQDVEPRVSAAADRLLAITVVALILVQTFLGVLVRQVNALLLTHVSVAAIVALAAAGAGMRAWGLSRRSATLRRSGAALMLVAAAQIVLGLTVVAFRTPPIAVSPKLQSLAELQTPLPVAPLPALLTTIHQANAAVMLAIAVVLAGWTWRLVEDRILTPSASEGRH
jgi:cytochrome c oxidase assembly protein subunit 15